MSLLTPGARMASRSTQPGANSHEPVGLLAGSGRFPILFAEAAKRQGIPVACVGIKYEASDELAALCDELRRRRRHQDGPRASALSRNARLRQIVMAGKITKSVMYTPWRIVQLWPDWRMIHYFYWTCRATGPTTRSCSASSPSSRPTAA